MVRCIPTFIIISLIASLSLNHPIGVEEIVETVGIQAVKDNLFDLETDAVHAEAEEEIISVVGPPYVVTEDEIDEIAGIQAVEDTEDDVVVGIQGVEEEDADIQVIGKKEKDIIVGIQGVEEIDEDVVEIQAVEDSTDVAEDSTDVVEDSTDVVEDSTDAAENVTSSNDVIIQTSDDQLPDDDMNMEFELFEEEPEETTTAAVTEDKIEPTEEKPDETTTAPVTEDKTEPVEETPEEIAAAAVDEEPEEIVIAAVDEEPEEVTVAAVEDGPEEITIASVIEENIVPVENTEEVKPVAVNAETANAFKKLAEDTLNKLRILHIFGSNNNVNTNNKRDSDSESSDSDDDNDNGNDNIKNSNYFEITEGESENETQGIDPDADITAEIFTNYFEETPTEFITEPIDPVENVTPIIDFDHVDIINNNESDDNTEVPILQKKQDDDDFVEIALYEVDDDIVKSNFDTVTEMITDVPVESASIDIDDDNQPTIGAIAIEEDDVEEEIPLFGVIIEEDEDEVAIAEFVEDPQANDEVDETIVISSNILIDVTEESDAVETDAATDGIEEEPTMIN